MSAGPLTGELDGVTLAVGVRVPVDVALMDAVLLAVLDAVRVGVPCNSHNNNK